MISFKNKTLKIHDTSTGTDVDLNAIKGDAYNLTEQDKSEIASQIHYDDSELRAEIESKAEVFVAEYGVTTYAEVKSAYESGKIVKCRITAQDGYDYVLSSIDVNYANFSTRVDANMFFAYVKSTDNSWSRNAVSRSVNFANNDNVHYPTTKAVADFFLGTNNVAPLTEAEKKSARERIGAEGGEFELIEEINITEETSYIARNVEPNGTPYKFRKIRVYFDDVGNTRTQTVNADVAYIKDGRLYGIYVPCSYNGRNYHYGCVELEVDCGFIKATNSHSSSLDGTGSSGSGLIGKPFRIEVPYIDNIFISRDNQSVNIPAGVVIKIFGVRV